MNESATKARRNLWILIALAAVYAALFIPPNLRCSANLNMLVCSSVDEYNQFPFVMSMTMRGHTIAETLQRVLDHKHYVYGYVFYAVSALVILPVRVFSDLTHHGYNDYMRAMVLLLREINPVCSVAAILVLVGLWTRFQGVVRATAVAAFMATLPAIVTNNTWWHPDGLVTLFVALTLYALSRDDLAFGRWFYGAAVFCGLAITTKILGVFFAPVIGLYLLLGLGRGRLDFDHVVARGAAFVGVLVLVVLATYPVLIVPHKAAQVVAALRNQSAMMGWGWGVRMSTGVAGHYTDILKQGFGLWPLYLAAVVVCLVAVWREPRERLTVLLVAAWTLSYGGYVVFFVANRSPYYFIPALLPLLSCFGSRVVWSPAGARGWLFSAAILALLTWQTGLNLRGQAHWYGALVRSEQTHPGIAFDRTLAQGAGPMTGLTMLREASIYVDPAQGVREIVKWGAITYADVQQADPDLIVVEQDSIRQYTDSQRMGDWFEGQGAASLAAAFYTDARAATVTGYRRVLETPYAVAFRRADDEGTRSAPASTEEERSTL